MTQGRSAEGFLPLRHVEREVLLSVSEEARHGYAISQQSEERNGGRSGFEIPTLYRALRRMRREGLIERVEAPPDCDDARRTYWVATPLGRDVLDAELGRLEAIVAAGRAARAGQAGGAR